MRLSQGCRTDDAYRSATTVMDRRRFVLGGAATWIGTAAALRLGVLLPEQCGAVSRADVTRAAEAAVAWFDRNQRGDGTWLYRLRKADGVDLMGYNEVRHAGVSWALWQAAGALDGAAAERAGGGAQKGVDRALDRLISRRDWAAFAPGTDTVGTGGSALLAAALVERRRLTGQTDRDEPLQALGRFLAVCVQPDGAVPASYDLTADRPVVGDWSPYFTGEVFWALARLATEFPDSGFAEPALRIGRYIATRRDKREGNRIPIADHWACYGLAELQAAGRADEVDPDAALSRRLGALIGVQVRFDAQRTNRFPTTLTRGPQGSAAFLGTKGEALGNLWDRARRRADDPDHLAAVADRAVCAAALLVDRQVSPADAADLADPSGSEGAWFWRGVTQMDDQQHALSALLLALPVLA